MIKEKIDEFYRLKEENKEKTSFWVSDAGKCPRAIWFSLKNYPKKPTEARAQRVFEHGNHTHMRIMGALFSLGLVNAVEIKIPENELVHGRADAIVNVNGFPYVIEIKSVNSQNFRNENPNPDHVKQLQLYLHFLKLKKGVLIYENKNTQEIKEFVIDYDEKIVKEILDFFKDLKEKVSLNLLPDIPKDLEKWKCEYCPYSEICKKIEK